jgi:thiosulfate dehydrogenase [quinone] large subunit
MAKSLSEKKYSLWQSVFLVTLRISIGWHMLYEGLVKVKDPNWSSFGYLMDSKGIFTGFFKYMATHKGILETVDFLNIWGLVLIGAGLIAGFFTRLATLCGILLLSLYFLSHPPLAGVQYIVPQEGSYLLINKTLIEIFALFVLLVFPTGRIAGIDIFFKKKGK